MRALQGIEVFQVSGGMIGGGTSPTGIPLLSAGSGNSVARPTPGAHSEHSHGTSTGALSSLCNWAGAVSGVAAATITGAAGVTLPVVGLVGLGVAGSVERICTLGVTAATGGIPTSHPR